MELEHERPDSGTTAQGAEATEAARHVPSLPRDSLLHEAPSALIAPDLSTAALRRCTALATRARADLLTRGRQDASAQLAGLLEEMSHWEPATLVEPDPTMTVLAAAALQDLAARLPAPAPSGLAARIEEVLPLLHAVMDRGRVAATA